MTRAYYNFPVTFDCFTGLEIILLMADVCPNYVRDSRRSVTAAAIWFAAIFVVLVIIAPGLAPGLGLADGTNPVYAGLVATYTDPAVYEACMMLYDMMLMSSRGQVMREFGLTRVPYKKQRVPWISSLFGFFIVTSTCLVSLIQEDSSIDFISTVLANSGDVCCVVTYTITAASYIHLHFRYNKVLRPASSTIGLPCAIYVLLCVLVTFSSMLLQQTYLIVIAFDFTKLAVLSPEGAAFIQKQTLTTTSRQNLSRAVFAFVDVDPTSIFGQISWNTRGRTPRDLTASMLTTAVANAAEVARSVLTLNVAGDAIKEKSYLEEKTLTSPRLGTLELTSLAVLVLYTGITETWSLSLVDGWGPLLVDTFFGLLFFVSFAVILRDLSTCLPFEGGLATFARASFGPWIGNIVVQAELSTYALYMASGVVLATQTYNPTLWAIDNGTYTDSASLVAGVNQTLSTFDALFPNGILPAFNHFPVTFDCFTGLEIIALMADVTPRYLRDGRRSVTAACAWFVTVSLVLVVVTPGIAPGLGLANGTNPMFAGLVATYTDPEVYKTCSLLYDFALMASRGQVMPHFGLTKVPYKNQRVPWLACLFGFLIVTSATMATLVQSESPTSIISLILTDSGDVCCVFTYAITAAAYIHLYFWHRKVLGPEASRMGLPCAIFCVLITFTSMCFQTTYLIVIAFDVVKIAAGLLYVYIFLRKRQVLSPEEMLIRDSRMDLLRSRVHPEMDLDDDDATKSQPLPSIAASMTDV
ncbi:hypothetical protein HK101_003305 [Irineochytrium annulatum]|nr:hypothetical protein HK101_003305 [Irineochytrium annulatum]